MAKDSWRTIKLQQEGEKLNKEATKNGNPTLYDRSKDIPLFLRLFTIAESITERQVTFDDLLKDMKTLLELRETNKRELDFKDVLTPAHQRMQQKFEQLDHTVQQSLSAKREECIQLIDNLLTKLQTFLDRQDKAMSHSGPQATWSKDHANLWGMDEKIWKNQHESVKGQQEELGDRLNWAPSANEACLEKTLERLTRRSNQYDAYQNGELQPWEQDRDERVKANEDDVFPELDKRLEQLAAAQQSVELVTKRKFPLFKKENHYVRSGEEIPAPLKSKYDDDLKSRNDNTQAGPSNSKLPEGESAWSFVKDPKQFFDLPKDVRFAIQAHPYLDKMKIREINVSHLPLEKATVEGRKIDFGGSKRLYRDKEATVLYHKTEGKLFVLSTEDASKYLTFKKLNGKETEEVSHGAMGQAPTSNKTRQR